MVAYLLYNKATPDERLMQDLAKRLETEEQVEVELMDADSPRGIQFTENYDVLGRPAVALVRSDGSPVQIWQGKENLPLPSDIGYQAHQ